RDSKSLSAIGPDGREVSISTDQIDRGGFVVLALPKPGDFTLPAGNRLKLDLLGKVGWAVVPNGRADIIWVQDPARPDGWRQLALPSPFAADPLYWAGGIFIPGRDGRAYLVHPVRGQSQAEPFVPKFDRDREGKWLSPALLGKDNVVLADQGGRLRR